MHKPLVTFCCPDTLAPDPFFLYPRPAKSPDLGQRLPAFSLLYRLSGSHLKISGKIIKFPAFVFSDKILKFIDKINWLDVN